MAKVLSIVAPIHFQQVEYLESKRALEEKGHKVFMASSERMVTDKRDIVYDPDFILSEVKVNDFDAILFVGGPGSHALFDDVTCHDLARAFHKAGKLTTAICAAPVILGRAGLLEGVKVTCFPDQIDDIKSTDAIYTGAHVQKDGLIITADGPESAYDFGLAIAKALK